MSSARVASVASNLSYNIRIYAINTKHPACPPPPSLNLHILTTNPLIILSSPPTPRAGDDVGGRCDVDAVDALSRRTRRRRRRRALSLAPKTTRTHRHTRHSRTVARTDARRATARDDRRETRDRGPIGIVRLAIDCRRLRVDWRRICA
jgi:hypothetical protein